MKNDVKKNIVISSLLWKLMERGGTQGIQFLVQIVLARLLLPEDYGTIALITVFITIANVFIQSGFNTALIQKKDADEVDFSSVFFLSIMVAGLLYVALFFAAPSISAFYNEPILVPVLRVLAITLFFGAFNSIQNAVLSRNMQFKNLFFSSLSSIILSGIVGIVMAYLNFGLWALVFQQLVSKIVVTIALWYTVKWRPKFKFSFMKVKSLFKYSWKLLVSTLIDTLYQDLRSLIIGKVYNSSMLGFYNKGKQFPNLIVTNVNGSIQSVMLPALSAEQDDRTRVKSMVRRSIVTSSFLIFPMMIGMAVTAEPLIRLLLTDKWLPAVPFLQIYCFIYALWPVHTANLQAINALGRSDVFLKLEIVKKVLGLIILVISLNFGVYAIALGGVVSGLISTFINSYPNKKLLNYSYKEQWQDIMPSLLISIVMGLIVYSIKLFITKIWLTLLCQISIGVIIYFGIARILKLECFNYLLMTIRNVIKNKKEKTI